MLTSLTVQMSEVTLNTHEAVIFSLYHNGTSQQYYETKLFAWILLIGPLKNENSNTVAYDAEKGWGKYSQCNC